MKCSKIFSGDLPELTNEIIQHFRHDYKTLHSCILVNRSWCRLAIPLLWEDPFSIPTGNYHFIKNYLNNLNDNDKTKLIEYEINLRTFEITMIRGTIDHDYFNGVLELILQNPNLIINIKNLKLSFNGKITNIIYSFLKFLYSNCKLISILYLHYKINYDDLLITKYSS